MSAARHERSVIEPNFVIGSILEASAPERKMSNRDFANPKEACCLPLRRRVGIEADCRMNVCTISCMFTRLTWGVESSRRKPVKLGGGMRRHGDRFQIVARALPRAERIAAPRPPKPISIVAQVAGSGTPLEINPNNPCCSSPIPAEK
jgi:hypothetical protein